MTILILKCDIYPAVVKCDLSILIWHIFTAPSAAPANVQGHNRSSTSIFVHWGEVPAAEQNGIIRNYTVTYKAFPDGSEKTKVIGAPRTEVTLTGLNEYTTYEMTVSASTSKGVGTPSKPVRVETDQDSKCPKAPVDCCNSKT